MSENEYISTGIENLDKLLGGGIQKGFTTLILGPPGSSIEILGKQISSTNNVLYITTDETEEDVKKAMERFGWKISNIGFLDISSQYSQEILNGVGRPINIYEQKTKTKIQELIKIGSSNNKLDSNKIKDYLSLMLEKIKNNSYDKAIINNIEITNK